MTRFYFFTSTAILLLATPLAAQEENQARFEIDRVEHDFGRVIDGNKAQTTFELRNDGKLDLVIEKVSASCGCTVPVPDPETIAPGGNGVMRIEFDSTGRAGAWRGSVVVHTNDPETPRLIVRLQAEVIPEVRLSTSYVYFGEVFRGEEQVREVVLENITFEGLRLEDHTLEGDAFSVEMADEGGAQPGGRFVFRVSLDPDAPYGYVEGNLYLRTNFEKNPLLRVFLISRVKGYVELSKPRVDFGILIRSDEATGRSEELTVFSHREEIEILRVEMIDLDFLTSRVETIEEKKHFRITLEVADGPTLGEGAEVPVRLRGTLVLFTTSRERPRIEVTVQMIVKTAR